MGNPKPKPESFVTRQHPGARKTPDPRYRMLCLVPSSEQCSVHPGSLLYIGDEILPNYMGIIRNQYKDPYKPIRISWFMSAKGFEPWLSFVPQGRRVVGPLPKWPFDGLYMGFRSDHHLDQLGAHPPRSTYPPPSIVADLS